jgi:signal transduction histidine kinase
MDPFFITTTIIPRLCFVILYAVAIAYLLSLKHKSAATWWLIAFCAFLCIDDMGWEVYSLVPMTQMSSRTHFLMFFIGQGLLIPAGLSYLQFAYAFRGNPYPREARILLGVGGAMAVGVVLVILFTPSYVASPLLMVVQLVCLAATALQCLWSAVVFLRKTLLFSRDALALQAPLSTTQAAQTALAHLRTPRGRAARACRMFFWITLLFLLFILVGVLIWGLLLFAEFGEFIANAIYLIFLYSLLVAYVTYAPEPTTVQVKLVGATLVTTLFIFVVLTRTVFSDETMLAESGLSVPPPQTLRFEPDGTGGYIATPLPLQWDAEAFGDTLHLDNEDFERVALPFPFPFYGKHRQELYVNDNGLVALDAPTFNDLPFSTWPLFHTFAFAAPLSVDLDPSQGGAIFYKTTPEAATVTWHEVPLRNQAFRFTAQLVLYPTGTLVFHYATPPGTPVATDPLRLGLRGLHPGGTQVAEQVLPPGPEVAIQSGAGVALVEDYMTQFFRYQEIKGPPLLLLILCATLFILFVFPLVFRYSLLKPLARLLSGVRQVEAGQTDTVVAVEVEDEIGLLTQHFNGMTHAIREAETQLQTYAETLEEKVEARTAELARSLEELKAAQAQLVQQEKMASLGALTAGIAHEIKNPLNFVNNFALLSSELAAELLQASDADPEQPLAAIRDDLDDLRLNTAKIHKHGQRADGIVQAMMAHARSSEGERRISDVNTLVEEYVNLAFHGMRAQGSAFNVTIEHDYDEAVGEVEMVPQEIGRVVLNLVNNAFYAVQQHSLSHNGKYTPTVSISTQRKGDKVEIRVTDNGPGIPAAVREKIFEPFFTTKPTGEGTGLGLSLSYDIITQGHGGMLTVESTPDDGTAFTITLSG